MSPHQLYDHSLLPGGARVYRLKSMEPSGPMASGKYNYQLDGRIYKHPKNGWATTPEGMDRLVKARRIQPEGDRLTFVMYADEGTATQLTAPWGDTVGAPDKLYVVQTNPEIIRRCMLMTTDPGDLILDPAAGAGTAAYVAEQWGRRWIAIDVSRVPLALTRQRLLTATFPWYALKDEARGPAGGFDYKRKQNTRGEEVGGIVPHITLGSIANDEPTKEVVLVDRPEVVKGITRVTGPFVVEATMSPGADVQPGLNGTGVSRGGESELSFPARMHEVLRQCPVLRLDGNRTVTFAKVRAPAKTLCLSAEAEVEGEPGQVAFVFGPENGAVSERLVFEAAKEANGKGYAHLYVIGFAIEPNARLYIERCESLAGLPATYVQATPDLLMGDLLKNLRSSHIFSVCGAPDVKLWRLPPVGKGQPVRYQVELLGIDTFDPVTMETAHRKGNDVPAWFLDTAYNGTCFHICQAFFPRTAAWDNLKRSLKGMYDDEVWAHLAGAVSAPFEVPADGIVAVKVVDDRGNELLDVRPVSKAVDRPKEEPKASRSPEEPTPADAGAPIQPSVARVTRKRRGKE